MASNTVMSKTSRDILYFTGTSGLANTMTYRELVTMPSDWNDNCTEYYTLLGTEYIPVEWIYNIIDTEIPDDEWSSTFFQYFGLDPITQTYNRLAYTYISMDTKPSDWESNYTNYFSHYSITLVEPTDWKQNFNQYYQCEDDGTFVNLSGPNAPNWEIDKYYSFSDDTYSPIAISDSSKLPNFKEGNYFSRTYPSFEVNKYFRQDVPVFESGKYYFGYSESDKVIATMTYSVESVEGIVQNVTTGSNIVDSELYTQYTQEVQGDIDKFMRDCREESENRLRMKV